VAGGVLMPFVTQGRRALALMI